MQKSTFQFSFPDLKITVAQIERTMGYLEGESHEPVAELTGKLLREAELVCSITGEYRIFPVAGFSDTEKSIEIMRPRFQCQEDRLQPDKKVGFGCNIPVHRWPGDR